MDAYRRLCTEFYDLDKPTAPADALAFYFAYAERSAGPILEPMCGSGRFLVPMRERGLDVDGVDTSADMLAACRAKLAARGITAALHQQPLEALDLPRRYALAFIPAGSFCLITDAAMAMQALQRLRVTLLRGGTLVLEVERHQDKPSHDWPWGGRWVERPDGARIVISWLGRYDATTRTSHSMNRYELVRDGGLIETEYETFDLRVYDVAEFTRMLETAGFTDVQTRKAYGDGPPDAADESVVFECRRP